MSIRLKSILVSVTEVCHVGCKHCGFIGSTRQREACGSDLSDWVEQVCDYGVPLVIFTGGEPFERIEALRLSVATANSRGTPSAVFTSCYWATSKSQAVETLSTLEGLTHLYLSSDVYHQARIPIEYIYNVIDAADLLGIPKITICMTYARDKDRRTIRDAYTRYGDRLAFYEERVIATPFMKHVVMDQDPLRGHSVDEYETTCWIDTPIINPNGDLFACHAGKIGAHGDFKDLPYWLGQLESSRFKHIMDKAEQNLAYQFLRTHGPKGIAEFRAETPELWTAEDRGGFAGRCDMCYSTLLTQKGRGALSQYVRRQSVIDRINIGLMARYGEPPICQIDRCEEAT